MLLAERYLQTQWRLDTVPRFTTDASFDTFHIISVSLHLQYHRLYFSDNSFPPSLLQPEGKELLFERRETPKPRVLSYLSTFKHWAQRNKACRRRQELKDFASSAPFLHAAWRLCIKSAEQWTELKPQKIWLPHPKLYFTNIAWPGQTVKLSFIF